MNKTTVVVSIIIALGAVLALLFFGHDTAERDPMMSYRDVEFRISGKQVQLVNGEARMQAAPDSASMSVVRYFGNDAEGDLNADGIPDHAFLITEESGGSGTFFYAVGAMSDASGRFTGTDAVFVGDRIAPQSTEIRDGLLIVNYADRAPGEPMSAQPHIGKSLYLKLGGDLQFGEVVQNFEGESAEGACERGTVRVGEGCMTQKDACEIGGDQYYFDEATQECLTR
ncbi:MAG: hypothetical protein WAZ27_02540 [Minisyncoccia bacterium]